MSHSKIHTLHPIWKWNRIFFIEIFTYLFSVSFHLTVYKVMELPKSGTRRILTCTSTITYGFRYKLFKLENKSLDNISQLFRQHSLTMHFMLPSNQMLLWKHSWHFPTLVPLKTKTHLKHLPLPWNFSGCPQLGMILHLNTSHMPLLWYLTCFF